MGYGREEPQKVIIFDWDDTICPSSFFDRQQMENMEELPESVSQLVVVGPSNRRSEKRRSLAETYVCSTRCPRRRRFLLFPLSFLPTPV